MSGNSSAAITPFVPQGIEQAMALANTLSKSGLLPEPLRNKPADVLVTLITGHELGLSPMQAVRGLHVINGKAIMSADLMVALVLKQHQVCEFFRLVESTNQKATYATKRHGSEPVTMTYTVEQAKQAGLAGRDTWLKHTAAMLRARCSSGLARAVYPDLVLGVYDVDEAQDFAPTFTAPPGPAAEPVAVLPPPGDAAGPGAAEEDAQVVAPEDESQDTDPVLAAIEAAKTTKELFAAMPKTPEARKPYSQAYEARRRALNARP